MQLKLDKSDIWKKIMIKTMSNGKMRWNYKIKTNMYDNPIY